MPNNNNPGIYIDEINAFPNSIAQVETAIPAFIGFTKNGDVNNASLHLNPMLIYSLLEFQTIFGIPETPSVLEIHFENNILKSTKFDTQFYLYNALQLFFENGGTKCYIVSIGDFACDINEENFTESLNVLKNTMEVTIVLAPDAVKLNQQALCTFQNELLSHCYTLNNRMAIFDLQKGDELGHAFKSNIAYENLTYGAMYTPWLKTNKSFTLSIRHFKNAQVLDKKKQSFIDKLLEVSKDILITKNSIQTSLSTLLKKLYLQFENTDFHDSKIEKEIEQLLIAHLTFYVTLKTEIEKELNCVPPSGAIAGLWNAVDKTRGIWKAPANIGIQGVTSPSRIYSSTEQQNLNFDSDTGISINLIRSFDSLGTLVWGSRTLAGNDNEWRYIPVRRLALNLEDSIRQGIQYVVFEPNDANTWVKLKSSIENFLFDFWKQGAFAGNKPEHAYFVKIGIGSTMTLQDIIDHKLIIQLGFAPLKPAEFMVISITLIAA